MNIGEALIEILADASSFASDVLKKTANPLKAVGKATSDAFATTFKIGMAGAAALATTAITKTINGGLSRLEGIDTAQARLRGIGVVGEELEAVMQQVNEAVMGTSISLDGAAQAAALMMTSGVEQGKPLEATLDALTNAAAATGKEITEITPLWQEMAVGGEATSNVIRRLGDMGVNALSALAEEFGVTQEEADKMVKSGKVSFEDFNSAIANQLGDMAEAVGNSFKGMKDNANAAFAMIGAAGLEPFKNAFTTAMPEILNFMYDLSAVIGEVAAPLNDKLIPAAEKLGNAFKEMDAREVFDGMSSGLENFKGLLAPLAGLAIGSLGPMLSGIPAVGRLFSGLTGPVGLVIGLFIEMWRNSETLREAVGKLFETFGDVMSALGPVISVLGETLGELVGTLGDMLGDAILTVLPLIEDLVAILGPALGDVMKMLQPLIQKLGGALGTVLVKALEKLVPPLLKIVEALLPVLVDVLGATIDIAMALIDALLPIVELLIDLLAPALEWVAEGVEWLVEWLTSLFTSAEEGASIWTEAWEWILEVISGFMEWFSEVFGPLIDEVWNGIMEVASTVAEWYQDVLLPIFESVGGLLGAVFELISTVATQMWEDLKSTFDAILKFWQFMWEQIQGAWDKIGPPLMKMIDGAITNLQNIWETVWNAVRNVFNIVWTQIENIATTVMDAVKNYIGIVLALLQGDWEGVWDGIKNFFGDIWEGIKTGAEEGIEAVWGFITGLKDDIFGFFADAGRWLWDAGKAILQGLWDGMKDVWNNMTGWIGDLGGWIADLKGPEEYDKKLLIPQGEWILQSLQTGAEREWKNVAKFFKGIGPAIDVDPRPVTAPAPAPAPAPVTGEPATAEFSDDQVQILARALFEAVRGGFGNDITSFFDSAEMGV